MIKYILIDVDDTVLDFQLCSKSSMQNACKEAEIQFSEDFFNTFQRVTRALWDRIEASEFTRSELHDVRFNMIFKELGIDFDGEKFETLYQKNFFESHITIDGAKELLEWLSKRFTVCAASNASVAQQKNRLSKAGLLPYFTHLFMSDDIGHQKPSRLFFEHALNTLGAEPSEVLMIGDSMSADIAGGAQCGLHTCLFWRKKDTPKGKLPPKYQVEKLSDIIKLSLFA